MNLSPEAVDLVQRARQLLVAAGPEGHTGFVYWNGDGSRRCTWGRIMQAHDPGHPLGANNGREKFRFETSLGREIDQAYIEVNRDDADEFSAKGFAEAVAALDALLLAAGVPSSERDAAPAAV